MTFEQFKEEVLNEINYRKEEECTVEVRKVSKNNGRLLTGIMLKAPKAEMVPSIYLEDMYEAYNAGSSMEELISRAINLYENSKTMAPVDMDFIGNYDMAKKRVLCRVVNTELNREFLAGVPHIDFLDLSVVFHILLGISGEGYGAITINNEIFEGWNIPLSILYNDALYNSHCQQTPSIDSIEDVLMGIIGEKDVPDADILEELKNSKDGGSSMFVMSNSSKTHGARGILDNQVLADFAARIGNDFYILPSSIHELIFVPDTGLCDKEALRSMVNDVNKNEVPVAEILSNQVYYYSRKHNMVSFA